MGWWAKIHLYDEFSKIHWCWYPKDWDKSKNKFYFYLLKIDWNPFYKIKGYSTFFEELNLTRKENVLINQKPTRKGNYKEHLKKWILNIAERINDFLTNFFFVLFCFTLSQINESNK